MFGDSIKIEKLQKIKIKCRNLDRQPKLSFYYTWDQFEGWENKIGCLFVCLGQGTQMLGTALRNENRRMILKWRTQQHWKDGINLGLEQFQIQAKQCKHGHEYGQPALLILGPPSTTHSNSSSTPTPPPKLGKRKRSTPHTAQSNTPQAEHQKLS